MFRKLWFFFRDLGKVFRESLFWLGNCVWVNCGILVENVGFRGEFLGDERGMRGEGWGGLC